MLVVVHSFFKRVEWPYYILTAPDYETALDKVAALVGDGLVLTKVTFVEDGKFTDLPVEIFDGPPFRGSMEKLLEAAQLLVGSSHKPPR